MIYIEPKVYCISRPLLDLEAIDDILQDELKGASWIYTAETDAELLIEFMGRLCYTSFGDKQGRTNSWDYLTNILAKGHGSVLEHANWSFVVCRAGRGYTHQQVRHRAGWAYSQESTHFIHYDDANWCFPGLPESLHSTALAAAEQSLAIYNEAFTQLAPLPKRTRLSIARAVIPMALESRLGFTANLRALRHFCEMRGSEDAAVEIRLVAAQICNLMHGEAPILFNDLMIKKADDGFPKIVSVYKKV